MKRTRFVLAGLGVLLVPAFAAAQQSSLSLGLLAGGVVADQAGADVFAPHDIFGFIGGGFLRVDVSRRVALELDALYAPKGGKQNTDRDPGDDPDRFEVDYIEFPLLFRVAFTSSGLRPALFAGPSVAIELSCRYDSFPDGVSNPLACAESGIATKSVDWGIAFGAALDIPLGSGALVVDGRGIVGLGTMDDSDLDLDYRNRILSLMVGYRFAL